VVLAAGCGGGGGVEAAELPLRENFAECEGFTMNDEVATIDCPEGELRVLVEQPDVSPSHFVPFRFDTKQQTLDASVRARGLKTVGAAWGIGCLASEPGEGGRGYLLIVDDDRAAAILSLDVESQEGDRFAQRFSTLDTAKDVIGDPATPHKLAIRCFDSDSGSVSIRGSINGRDALFAEDRPGLSPFTAAASTVLASRPGTDVRFDDLQVTGTPEIKHEDAHGSQEARIALVKAAAEKEPKLYGEVASVFCQSESPSCVVTYTAPACQFWFVENVNGKDVATPDDDQKPIVGGHGKYSEDNPDAIGCG
jgi:hypothetical protein